MKKGEKIVFESDECIFERGVTVKNLLIEVSKQNEAKKIGLISHSVLLKTIFSKLENGCLVRNPHY